MKHRLIFWKVKGKLKIRKLLNDKSLKKYRY